MKAPSFERFKDCSTGFESFKAALKEAFEQEDADIICMMAPLAKGLLEKKFPQKQAPAAEIQQQIKVNIQTFMETVMPLLETILPSVPAKLKAQKGRSDVNFSQTTEMTLFLAEKIAPQIGQKIRELKNRQCLFANATQSTKHEESIIQADTWELQKLTTELKNIRQEQKKAEISQMLKATAEKKEQTKSEQQDAEPHFTDLSRVSLLTNRIEFLQQRIKRYQMAAEEKKKILQETMYDSSEKSINIQQEYTNDDALSLVHETAHAVTPNVSQRLSEIPSITAEIIANRYMQRHNMGQASSITLQDRINDMQQQSAAISAMSDVFTEIQRTGDVTFETTDNFMRQTGQHAGLMRPEDYSYLDVFRFAIPLKDSAYFTGTASALVLIDRIKSKEDLQQIFRILNNPDITDIQKMQQLGITQEKMISALNQYIKKTRTVSTTYKGENHKDIN